MASDSLLLGANPDKTPVMLLPSMANRHGLIAGATGTGKTVTLQVLAESFARLGVPVFTADIKGDLSGLAASAKPHARIDERIAKIGIRDYSPQASPVIFWDLFGAKGHPVRTTISELGPVLLSSLLELNETQEGVLHIAFSLADDEGLLLLDIKDLRALLEWMTANRETVSSRYGNVSSASIGAIQRRLHVLAESGGDRFFGEPALQIRDLMRTDLSGRGVISLLDGTRLMMSPRIYATFLLWLLSELFEQLDEVGDPDKPRLVFFFDEAHLLFTTAPKALLQRIEQVVRLIRSKGVGVYFVTQSPADIPDSVLAQLGNRVQHALRAYTPREQKAVRVAAESFRANPALEQDTATMISELGMGEALVSVLDSQAQPTPVERTLICPPRSQIGPASEAERNACIQRSPLTGIYDTAVDRESAFELLRRRADSTAATGQEAGTDTPTKPAAGSRRQSATEAFFKSMLRSIGSQLGRQIIRGVLGSITAKR